MWRENTHREGEKRLEKRETPGHHTKTHTHIIHAFSSLCVKQHVQPNYRERKQQKRVLLALRERETLFSHDLLSMRAPLHADQPNGRLKDIEGRTARTKHYYFTKIQSGTHRPQTKKMRKKNLFLIWRERKHRVHN